MYRQNKRFGKKAGLLLAAALFGVCASHAFAKEQVKICEEDEVAIPFGGERYSLVFDENGKFLYTDWGFWGEFYRRTCTHKKDELEIKWQPDGSSVVRYGDARPVFTAPAGVSVGNLGDSGCFVVFLEEGAHRCIYDSEGTLLLELEEEAKAPEDYAQILYQKDRVLICEKEGTGYEIDLRNGREVTEIELPVAKYFPEFKESGMTEWRGEYFYLRDWDREDVVFEIRDRGGYIYGSAEELFDDGSVYYDGDEQVFQDLSLTEISRVPMDTRAETFGYYDYTGKQMYGLEWNGSTFYPGECYEELGGKICDGYIPYGDTRIPCAITEEEILVSVNRELVSLPVNAQAFNDRYVVLEMKEDDGSLEILLDRETGEDICELLGIQKECRYWLQGDYVIVEEQYNPKGYQVYVLDNDKNVTLKADEWNIRPWKDGIVTLRRGPYLGFADIYGNWIGKTVSPEAEIDN